MRLAGMQMAAAVVEGLNPLDRNVPSVHQEAWKLFERGIKVRMGTGAGRITREIAFWRAP
jgi:hypothetical protein